MSGMCERSAFDTFYHMDNDEKGLVIFYGFEVLSFDMTPKRDCGSSPSSTSRTLSPHVNQSLPALYLAITTGR